MPSLFTCPNCGYQTVVDDAYVGQIGPCVACGQTVVVTADDSPRKSTVEQRRLAASSRDVRLTLVLLFVLVFGGGIVAWASYRLIIPEFTRHADQRRQAACVANLTRIGQALAAYHQVYKSFPPAIVYDSNGRAKHSWRVLLLPFLGETQLYNMYNMDEPWDGPNNSLLVHAMPDVYADPSDSATPSGETCYLAIRGDGTVFPRQGAVQLSDIVDGPGETVAIVESAGATITWIEPHDLLVTRMSFRIAKGRDVANAIGALHGDGPHVLLADGTVKKLRTDAPPSELRAMTTIRGRDSVRWSVVAH